MRTAFIDTLCDLAAEDPRIWLLTGDLGYSFLERFASQFPSRFLNAGVAEQNMLGVAAGLAMSGKTVFVYSIANFPTLRCLEQVRNDVCYHKANVKVVAIGGGVMYGTHGYTHYGVEDIAVMSALPHMTVCAPCDTAETIAATRLAADRSGPFYVRLGRAGALAVHSGPVDLTRGVPIVLRDCGNVGIIATGAAVPLALDVANTLSAAGILSRVLSVPIIRPLDAGCLLEVTRKCSVLCVIEDHGRIGGLADAVARCLAMEKHCPLLSFGLDNEVLTSGCIGTQAYLHGQCGLSAKPIANAIARVISANTAGAAMIEGQPLGW